MYDDNAGAPPNDAEQATEAAYLEFGGALLRYAEQLARSQEEARDAVQEVFLRYFVEKRYGRIIESTRAWLYRVLRNYLLDRIKAASSQLEIRSENLERMASQCQRNPEELAERSQAAREIALTLSEREYTCLTLRVEGLSYAEIGLALEIRTGTVGALLSRAQTKLRRYEKKNLLGVSEALLCLLQEGVIYSTP